MTFPPDVLDVFAGLVVGVIVGAALDRVIVRESELVRLERALRDFEEHERQRGYKLIP